MRRGPLMAQTAPGTWTTVYAPGTAMMVKAGTVLTFQIHYTTNGKVSSDKTSMGFIFAKQPPTIEMRTSAMLNPRFMIPAGADNHPVEAGVEFTEDITLYSIVPHTHLRGKSWKHTLTYPDGREEVLLAVPNYDFNWQTRVHLRAAAAHPEGRDAEVGRALRQLEGQQVQPRPDAGRLLGRPDVGRDAVHGALLHRRQSKADDGGRAEVTGKETRQFSVVSCQFKRALSANSGTMPFELTTGNWKLTRSCVQSALCAGVPLPGPWWPPSSVLAVALLLPAPAVPA